MSTTSFIEESRSTIGVIVFCTFIALKVAGISTWSWWWLLLPLVPVIGWGLGAA